MIRPPAFEVRAPRNARDWARARALVEAYGAELGQDLDFQGFAAEVADLPLAYPPPGGMWLASLSGRSVGCVGLRTLGGGRGELKRLYVAPSARGSGVGRALVESALGAARSAGWRAVRLDTLPAMEVAHALYRSLGFRSIAPYRRNPIAGASFLELEL